MYLYINKNYNGISMTQKKNNFITIYVLKIINSYSYILLYISTFGLILLKKLEL